MPIRGRRRIAAVASVSTTGALEYEIYVNFQREYSDIFGLEQGLRWSDYDGLVLWLDAMVHNSFVWYGTPSKACHLCYVWLFYITKCSL